MSGADDQNPRENGATGDPHVHRRSNQRYRPCRSDTLRPVRMNIIKNRVSDVTVLDIQGVIKLGESAREFSSYLEKVLNDETGPVMINFEAINYMDSTGLGELIGYLQKFEDRQRKMALVKPSHRILALLKITKLDTVFKIFDSRDTAMQYLTESVA